MNKLVAKIAFQVYAGGHEEIVARTIPQLDGRHGWKIVPVEPTKEMRDAGDLEQSAQQDRNEYGGGPIYRAMLASSPDPLADDPGSDVA